MNADDVYCMMLSRRMNILLFGDEIGWLNLTVRYEYRNAVKLLANFEQCKYDPISKAKLH